MKPDRKGRTPQKPESLLSGGAHALAAIGTQTARIVMSRFGQNKDNGEQLFTRVDEEDLKRLANAFPSWNDAEAAKVIDTYADYIAKGRQIEISSLQRWVRAHPNDAQAVLDCLSIIPPSEITLTKVLSRAGSQKLVFLATWHLTQREVVLKRLTGPPELVEKIIAREAQSHPLSMIHPNIIETHVLRNSDGEVFLVEDRLPDILSDSWKANGLSEAANLLYDIANALNYLHVQLGLIHGDVKPDNIGRREREYILLDFGICRPAQAFTPESTPTGSLRTRAPELLEESSYVDPYKADVWALAATVYNSLADRFPLFEKGEQPPRIWNPQERKKFEQMLADRVRTKWDQKVDLSLVSEPLRNILSSALERDPDKRCSAADLMNKAEKELSAFLRHPSDMGPFSPIDELNQLRDYLPEGEAIRLMPVSQKLFLQTRLQNLKLSQGLSNDQLQAIDYLLEVVR